MELILIHWGLMSVSICPVGSHWPKWSSLHRLASALRPYIGGPRLRRWIATVLPAVCDWADVSGAMAPQKTSPRLRRHAGHAVGRGRAGKQHQFNLPPQPRPTTSFLRQAELAVLDLQSGRNLPAALGRFDREAEFSWRLANAAHGPEGFASALSGWTESLDAKAFQEEQTFFANCFDRPGPGQRPDSGAGCLGGFPNSHLHNRQGGPVVIRAPSSKARAEDGWCWNASWPWAFLIAVHDPDELFLRV